MQKKQKNEYLYTIVHITGDFSYIIKHRRSIKALKLNKLDGFSGKIRYFTLKGEMLWGEIYKDGRKVGTISVANATSGINKKQAQTRAYETYCESHFIEYETCYHFGYDMGEGYIENGVECFYDYSWEEYCYQEWVEEACPACGSSGCSGGCQPGGGSNNQGQAEPQKNVNKVHIAKNTDVIANRKILEFKRKSQRGNTCVPTVLEYILKTKNSNDDRKDIAKFYNGILSKNGTKYRVKTFGVPSNIVPRGVIVFFRS